MRKSVIAGAMLMLGIELFTPVFAQTTSTQAPSPSASTPNTLPQAPSGGEAGRSGANGTGKSVIGEPTDVERKAQEDSKKSTVICKGC